MKELKALGSDEMSGVLHHNWMRDALIVIDKSIYISRAKTAHICVSKPITEVKENIL